MLFIKKNFFASALYYLKSPTEVRLFKMRCLLAIILQEQVLQMEQLPIVQQFLVPLALRLQ